MNKIPTHYFVYVGYSNNTKNKLHEDFQQYLKSLAGTLITADKLDDFKKQIITKSTELNKIYHRCYPLELTIEEMHFDKGYHISGFYSVTFQILKAFE